MLAMLKISFNGFYFHFLGHDNKMTINIYAVIMLKLFIINGLYGHDDNDDIFGVLKLTCSHPPVECFASRRVNSPKGDGLRSLIIMACCPGVSFFGCD